MKAASTLLATAASGFGAGAAAAQTAARTNDITQLSPVVVHGAAREVLDLDKENEATLDLYGLKRGQSGGFGWQCFVARRLAERGARFVELVDGSSAKNWDRTATGPSTPCMQRTSTGRSRACCAT